MSGEAEIVERHPELYFPTGDVALRAAFPSTPGSVPRFQIFRVHKVILGLHSAAFSNLFADASAGLGPTYDDVPMVEMPDRADDLAGLLDCVYNPSHYYLSRRSRRYKTALELSGIVRLADKYLLDSLRADLVQRVVDEWPKDILEWDIREAELEKIKTAIMCGTQEQSSYYMDCMPEPASAIMFAEEFGCREVLPAAFCSLARVGIHNEWEKAHEGGGYTSMLFARWTCLDSKNLLRFIRGCEYLDRHHESISQCIQDGVMLSPSCMPWWTLEKPVDHSRARDDEPYPCLRFIKRLRDAEWAGYYVHDPMGGLQTLLDCTSAPSNAFLRDLCGSCHGTFRRWVRDQRNSVWKRMPRIFELDQ
ncbi:hypothetical protein VTO73DRAFT_11337 [Trametes versicolor]